MEQNDQNRNFTISSKVSSSQKAKYMQEALRLKLPLSEWICGTLDVSINAYKDINKITEVKQLQEDSSAKDKIINSLSSSLKIVKSHLDLKKTINLKKDNTILELNMKIQNLQNKIINGGVSKEGK